MEKHDIDKALAERTIIIWDPKSGRHDPRRVQVIGHKDDPGYIKRATRGQYLVQAVDNLHAWVSAQDFLYTTESYCGWPSDM